MREELHFSDYDSYLFGHSTHYDLYTKLGAHKAVNEDGVYFAVWAPHAQRVCVAGDFNGWDTNAAPMTKTGELGVWETIVPNAKEGDCYKFAVTTAEGKVLMKADPFAAYAELRPGTASKIFDTSKIKWADKRWMNKRKSFDIHKDAMTIYECHIGSWMRHPIEEEGIEGFYTYREFAEKIADYCRDMG